MMMAIGLSQYNVALMHTVNHAFFKALLFLGAGAVIHSFADQQDIRKMGGLIKFLPFTYSVMLTGSLSLLATPYLTGFYSKDLILELAYGQYNFSGIYAYILGSITAGITAFYSFRLISLVFLTTPNGNKQSYFNSCPHAVAQAHSQEAPLGSKGADFSPTIGKNKNAALAADRALVAAKAGGGDSKKFLAEKLNLIVIFPLLILALFSIFFGFVFSDLFVGIGSDFFKNSIFMHPKNISLIEAEFALSFDGPLMGPVKAGYGETSLSQVNNIFIKLLPAILSFTGAFSAFILYNLQHSTLPLPTAATQRQATQQMQPLEKGGCARFATLTPKEGLFLINLTNNKIGKNIYAFLNGKYFFDVIYNHFFIQRGLSLGYNISKEIDRGAIEFLGPYGLSNYFYNAGKNLAKLDTGVITTYSLYITIALISLLIILFYPALELATNYIGAATPPLAGSATFSAIPTATPTATQGNDPQSLEELRLFIIYITSALIVLSPYPPVFLYKIKN
jgi:NADH-ubiquinone oxidoreductase chain 5